MIEKEERELDNLKRTIVSYDQNMDDFARRSFFSKLKQKAKSAFSKASKYAKTGAEIAKEIQKGIQFGSAITKDIVKPVMYYRKKTGWK